MEYFSSFTRKALKTKTPPRDACLVIDYQDNQASNQSIKTQACPILNRDSDKLDSQGKYNFPEVACPRDQYTRNKCLKSLWGPPQGKIGCAQECVSRIHQDGVLQDPVRREESED